MYSKKCIQKSHKRLKLMYENMELNQKLKLIMFWVVMPCVQYPQKCFVTRPDPLAKAAF